MNDSIDRQFAQITESGLDRLRERIGTRIENSLEPWCHEATRDNIRHYAHGIGDDNPLWCDPDYAANTKYGGIIALPSFLFACDRIISGYVGGLPGVHAMWAGANWSWHKPVRRIHHGQRPLGSLRRMTPLEVTRPTRPGSPPEQSHCWCVPSPSSGKAGIDGRGAARGRGVAFRAARAFWLCANK